jgi:hypothetical protein
MPFRISGRALMPAILLSLIALLPACDDTTGPGGSLLVDLVVAPAHIHSFESNVAFTVSVTDGRRGPVTDFVQLRAEIGPAGTDHWTREIPLLYDGTEWVGTTKFTAAGSFDARIVGQRPGQPGTIELHRLPSPLSAVRPHFEAGGYRVEFETDSGEYPREGESVMFHFLIMEDVSSPRPPVTGLAGVSIRCTQGAEVEVHAAVEGPPGTYSAAHVFTSTGGATAQIEFTGSDASPAAVQIPLNVEHGSGNGSSGHRTSR